MSDTAALLADLPLFFGVGADELGPLVERLVERELAQGELLFEADAPADHLFFLMEGQVDLLERSGKVQVSLRPVAPIGELGAMTRGVTRNTTAVAAVPSKVLAIARMELMEVVHTEDLGVRLQQNLLDILSDKIGRDGRRIAQMRRNLMRTQKEMKRLREELLSHETTPISDLFHDSLEGLIQGNRRAHYAVVPPRAYPATVRCPDGTKVRVGQISRTRVRLPLGAVGDDDQWSGVLTLPTSEIPLSGTIVERTTTAAEVELDLLIDEYEHALEDYLTRAQMLDLVV